MQLHIKGDSIKINITFEATKFVKMYKCALIDGHKMIKNKNEKKKISIIIEVSI